MDDLETKDTGSALALEEPTDSIPGLDGVMATLYPGTEAEKVQEPAPDKDAVATSKEPAAPAEPAAPPASGEAPAAEPKSETPDASSRTARWQDLDDVQKAAAREEIAREEEAKTHQTTAQQATSAKVTEFIGSDADYGALQGVVQEITQKVARDEWISEEERESLAKFQRFSQAREIGGVIYTQAEQAAWKRIQADVVAIPGLIPDLDRDKFYEATQGERPLIKTHQMAFDAGKAAATKALEGDIVGKDEQIRTLKLKLAGHAPGMERGGLSTDQSSGDTKFDQLRSPEENLEAALGGFYPRR